MNLSELLTYADIGQLNRMARHYDIECDTNSKNELIQSLLSAVKRKDFIRKMLDGLDQENYFFLLLLMLDVRPAFSKEDLHAKAKIAFPEHTEKQVYREMVKKALQNGWVFPAVQTPHASFYRVPADFKRDVRSVLTEKFLEDANTVPSVEAYRDEGTALVEDMKTFLRFVREHQPKVTNEGAMYRRYQKKLIELFAVSEELVNKKEWRFGYGRYFRSYPDRLSFLYDYAYYRGFIEEGEACLHAGFNADVFIENATAKKWLPDMVQFWLRLYKRPVVQIPFVAEWVRLVCQETWVEEDSLIRSLKQWVKPFYFDTEERIIKIRVLKMMVHLGLLRKSFAKEKTYYRITDDANTLFTRVEGFSEQALNLEKP